MCVTGALPDGVPIEGVSKALRVAGYMVEEKEGGKIAIRKEKASFELKSHLFNSTQEARRETLDPPGFEVSAGIQTIVYESDRTVRLHREFLFAHKGSLFFKLESKSGHQKEHLKQLSEIIMAALP